jgi:non-specific serine/threonine protein kinase
MLEAHERAAKTSAEGLGRQRFTALRSLGAACPLDAAVKAAADDADELGSGPLATAAGRLAASGVARSRPSELTSREREIAGLVARGLSNREIATRLVISKRTVDAHVEHIFGKLGMSSRVQLTLWLREQQAGQHGTSSGAKST